MRIAFDLDGTLVPASGGFATEPPQSIVLGWLVSEQLRTGATALLRDLATAGHELWVYTTSLRPLWMVRLLFRAYGAGLAGVVNQAVHDRAVGKALPGTRPSKYPPAFGIDLLVDDSEGVVAEGRAHGFPVLLVAPSDPAWADRIRREVGV